MPQPPQPDAKRAAQRLLARRAARVKRIRRNVVASGLATFVLAFALVVESGSFGSVSASTASTSGTSTVATATTSSTATTMDGMTSQDDATQSDDSSQNAVSPVTTSQS